MQVVQEQLVQGGEQKVRQVASRALFVARAPYGAKDCLEKLSILVFTFPSKVQAAAPLFARPQSFVVPEQVLKDRTRSSSPLVSSSSSPARRSSSLVFQVVPRSSLFPSWSFSK